MKERKILCPHKCPRKTEKTGDEVIEFVYNESKREGYYRCTIYDGDCPELISLNATCYLVLMKSREELDRKYSI